MPSTWQQRARRKVAWHRARDARPFPGAASPCPAAGEAESVPITGYSVALREEGVVLQLGTAGHAVTITLEREVALSFGQALVEVAGNG